MRCGGRGGYTDIDWSCHRIINNKAHETNTMTHMQRIPGPVLHSPRLEMKIHLSSSVLQCANQNVKSITLQAGGKSRQIKFSTRTVSGPWWVLVSPAGDTWRGGSDSSLTDMQERELKRVCQHRRCILTGAQITTSIYDQLSV